MRDDSGADNNDVTMLLCDDDNDGVSNIDVVRRSVRKLEKKKDQESALNKLGGVGRYKVDVTCLADQFVVGAEKTCERGERAG